MKHRILCAGLALALAAASGSAAAEQCLRSGNISDWKVVDNQTIVVTEGTSTRFRLTLMNTCSGLHFTEALAFKSTGKFSCMTQGDSVLFHDGGWERQCFIKSIDLLPDGDGAPNE